MKKLLSLTLALFLALGNLSPIAMAEAVDTKIVPDENITEGENNTNPVPEAGEAPTEPAPEVGEAPTEPAPMAAPMMVPMALKEKKLPDGFQKNEDGVIHGVAYKTEDGKEVATDDTVKDDYIGKDNLKNYIELEFNTHLTPETKDGHLDYEDNEFYYVFLPKNNPDATFCLENLPENGQNNKDDYEISKTTPWGIAEDVDHDNANETLIEISIDKKCVSYNDIKTIIEGNKELKDEVGDPSKDDDIDIDVGPVLVYAPQGKLTVSKAAEDFPEGAQNTFKFNLVISGTDKSLKMVAVDGADKHEFSGSDGKYTFTLKVGESVTIIGIPSDAKYEVTEEKNDKLYKADEVTKSGSIKDNNTVTFTNTFNDPAPVEAYVEVEKVLEGTEWGNKTFEFEISDGSNGNHKLDLPEPRKKRVTANNTKVTFGPIKLYDDNTFYIFNIKETEGTIPGVKYDTKEHKVLFSVKYATDANGVYNGKLKVSFAKVDDNEVQLGENNTVSLTITNTYSAKPVDLDGITISKTLEGREWKDTDNFKFNITSNPSDGVEIKTSPVEISNKGTKVNEKTYSDKLGATFKKAGTYTLTVKEEKGNLGGITYDETAKTITVVVTDNGEGKLTAKRTDKTELIFNNKYSPSDLVIIPTRKPDEEGMIGIALEKIIENSEWRDGYKFDFKIEPLDGAPAPTETVCTVTGPNQQFDFGILTIKADDMGGAKEKSFRYKVTEVIPEEPIPGITYTTEPVTFVVKVRDNGEGFLIAEGHILNESDNTNTGKFVNKYSAKPVTLTGETAITATKKLTGRDWTADDSFEFTLKSTEVPEGVEFSYESKKNATRGNEKVVFNDITFNTTGTYKFLLSETVVKNIGIEYPETVEIVVEVTDEGKGQLVAKIAEDKYNYELENMYSAEPAKLTGETGLHVKKILVGRPWEDNDKFEFKLEPIKDYGNDISINADKSTAFATKEKHEALEIGDITFNKAGTYEFKLYEVAGSEKYMHYDTAVRNITVSVNDNNKGNLEVTAVNGNKEFAAFEFENIFVEENLIYITKQVAKTTTDMAFDFDIVFTDLEGKNLSDDEVNFNWTKGEEKGKFTKAADTFKLADDETIVIELPENVRIKVTEKPYNHYEVTIKENGDELQGKEEILAGGEDAKYEVTNTYKNRRPDPKPRPDDDDDDDDDKKPTPRPYPIIRPIEIPSTGANI